MKLRGKKIAYLVEEGFEDLEFWVPLMRLQEEGAQVTVVSDRAAEFNGLHGLRARADIPDFCRELVSALAEKSERWHETNS